jgi:chromosome segregation ATPase
LAIQYNETSEGETQENETPKNEPEPKENPDSFQYWQSVADKKEKELQELRNQYQQGTQQFQDLQREIGQLREQLNPKPKDEPLVAPQKPNSDDPMDLIKWQSDYLEYQNKLIQKTNEQLQQTSQGWQQEMQRRQQEERFAQEKAYHLSQLQKQGLSVQEANEAFALLSKASQNPDEYYKDLTDYYRVKKGQYNTPKGVNMGKRATRQGEAPSLANMPSETETQNNDPSEEFFGDIQNFVNRHY